MDVERHQLLAALGKAIRAVREEHGLSTHDLSLGSRVAEATIAALEEGRLDPTFELLLSLARGLGVRPGELFTRAEALSAPPGDATGSR